MSAVVQSRFVRLQRGSLFVGVAGLALCGVGLVANGNQLFISWLTAEVFWLGLSLGCLMVAMIHHLTGGRWGFVTRRFLEAGYMTLPLMGLLLVPVFFGLHVLYPWAQPDAVAASETLQAKRLYLNTPAFVVRAAVYFALWIGISLLLRRWSIQQDGITDPKPTVRMRALSGPGIVVLPITGTFAFVDWVMSTEPHWYSTIFPVIVLIGQILVAFALITVMLAWLSDTEPFRDSVESVHFHSLGNLLLAFVVFWTYVSLSQLIIIYSGDLPREISWYLSRIAGGWKWIVLFLVAFHFAMPFFLLLFRKVKRNANRLAAVAALIFLVHIVEVFWIIQPTFFHAGLHVHWLDFAAVLGIGGAWFAMFTYNLNRHPLTVRNDPRDDTAGAHASNER